MFKFKVGDRVVYTGNYKIASKKYKNKKGTIERIGSIPDFREEEQVFDIKFDGGSTLSMYLANLEPAKDKIAWEV